MAKTKTSVKITPLGDRVLVKRSDADAVTKGGIILPDTAKEKPKEGTVIAVGQGRRLENDDYAAFSVKPKDRVLFSSYAGSEIQIEGDDYLILSEDEILAVIDG